jgi:hypothetical protein
MVMRLDCANRHAVWLLAAGVLLAAAPTSAQDDGYQAKLAHYNKVHAAYEAQASAYWDLITEKRRGRIAKRRNHQAVGIDDYVLTHPPVYSGPPRPVDPDPSAPKPKSHRPEIPVVADFLKNAAEQFGFVPRLPESERAFKQAYAEAASAAGLTRDQIVRVYAFETGGNGTYDAQAGLVPPRPHARAISPAVGYNQLLSTNSVSLLAEHGEDFVKVLRHKAASLSGGARATMDKKIEALRRMIAYSRTVPHKWSEFDRLAKTTPGGIGIHAVVLDLDLGPLLQVRKLVNSVRFARVKGHAAPLTGAELELLNFTGDGNGIDIVMMPHALREKVPTANFFQRQGYERNPIARRTGTVAALIASIDAKMEQYSKNKGAREMAAAFGGSGN